MAEPRNSHNRASRTKLTQAERRRRAMDLRMLGQTYEQIGDALGISRQAAHKMITRELGKIRQATEETAQEILDLELMRLDRLMATAMQAVIGDKDITAIDRALRCMERRSKYLGLDKPDKTAQTDPEGKALNQPDPYERALALVADMRRELEQGGESPPSQPAG